MGIEKTPINVYCEMIQNVAYRILEHEVEKT